MFDFLRLGPATCWQLSAPRIETLGQLMDVLGDRYGDRLLVHEGDDLDITFSQAADLVCRVSNAVADRVGINGRVVLRLPNGYELFLSCLGVARAGAIAVPLSDQLTQGEVDRIVQECEPAMLVTDFSQLMGDLGEPAAFVDPDDTAAVFYTSGTTGRPKGVELSHRALLARLSPIAYLGGLASGEAVFGLPLSHLMGFIFALSMSLAGFRVRFFPRFEAKAVLDAIESERPQIFAGVPAMFRMLLEAGAEERDLESIRVWFSSADAMPNELARAFQDFGAMFTLPNGVSIGSAAFVEGYGMVELGGAVAAKFRPALPFKSDTVPAVIRSIGESSGVGLPLGGAKLKVSNSTGSEVLVGSVGELWVRSSGALKGYYKDPAATAAVLDSAGWIRTGDLVRRGPLGVIYFVGREKDVIKVGGYSVYAREVEEVLEEHPCVAEASVVGISHDTLGEVPVAAVRLMPDAEISTGELLEWCRERLAHYKAPRDVKVVQSLPRTETAKVKRSQLRALFEKDPSASS